MFKIGKNLLVLMINVWHFSMKKKTFSCNTSYVCRTRSETHQKSENVHSGAAVAGPYVVWLWVIVFEIVGRRHWGFSRRLSYFYSFFFLFFVFISFSHLFLLLLIWLNVK